MTYEPRHYRRLYQERDLKHFQVVVAETDLHIGLDKEDYTPDLPEKVKRLVIKQRYILGKYLNEYPDFLTTLKPWDLGKKVAPCVVRALCGATTVAGVGPMAAVAGFFAEQVGLFLTHYTKDVLVENGGDLWLQTSRPRQVSIYAGSSAFSEKVGLVLKPEETPLGICTSSGTVGHSFSMGQADAVVVLASSAVLADAVATATCNLVEDRDSLLQAVEWGLAIPGIRGIVAILDDKMVVQGQVELTSLE